MAGVLVFSAKLARWGRGMFIATLHRPGRLILHNAFVQIDTFEGVNQVTMNQMGLHTSPVRFSLHVI